LQKREEKVLWKELENERNCRDNAHWGRGLEARGRVASVLPSSKERPDRRGAREGSLYCMILVLQREGQ